MTRITRNTARALGVAAAAFALALAAPAMASAEGELTCTSVDDEYTGTTLTYTVASKCSGGASETLTVQSITTQPDEGVAKVSDDGTSVSYEGVVDHSPTVVNFVAVVTDGTDTVTWPFKITYNMPEELEAVADTFKGNSGTPITGNVTTNDLGATDAEVSLVSGPGHGKLELNKNGQFTYKSDADFSGTDTFVYRLTVNKLTSEATVTIEVAPPGSGGGSPSPTPTTTTAKPPLAKTGFSLVPVALTGAGVLAAGVGVLWFARRKREA